jgi:asparagine synthetase A
MKPPGAPAPFCEISDSGKTNSLNRNRPLGFELRTNGLRVLKKGDDQQFAVEPAENRQAIPNNEIPLSIGGGIGQSRTLMLLLRNAHLGEVSVSVWPKILKEMCAQKNIYVFE